MSEYEVCPDCMRHDGTHDEWCIELEIATLKKQVKEARKQAFLEAAEMVANWEQNPESTMVKCLREKAGRKEMGLEVELNNEAAKGFIQHIRREAFLGAVREVESIHRTAFDSRWDVYDTCETIINTLKELADEEV